MDEQNPVHKHTSFWRRETKFSKYTALVLFVLFPVIGFWLGAKYEHAVFQYFVENSSFNVPDSAYLNTRTTLSNGETTIGSTVPEQESLHDSTRQGETEIDFSKCQSNQIASGAAGFHAGGSIIVLGESRFDGNCHILYYVASALGAGRYELHECFVPMTSQTTIGTVTEDKVVPDVPSIPTESSCELISSWQGQWE